MRYRQRSFVLIILGTLLVTIPLCLTRYRSVTNTIAVNKTTKVVQEWLQDKTDRIMSVSVDGPPVSVSIEGPEQLGSVNELLPIGKRIGIPGDRQLTYDPHKNRGLTRSHFSLKSKRQV